MENLKTPTKYSRKEVEQKIGLEYHVEKNARFNFKSMIAIEQLCKEASDTNGPLNTQKCISSIINAFGKELPFSVYTELKNTFTKNMREEQGDLQNQRYNKAHIFASIEDAKIYALNKSIAYEKRMLEKVMSIAIKRNIFSKMLMKLSKDSYLKRADKTIKKIANKLEQNRIKVIDVEYFNIISSNNINKMHFLTNNPASVKHNEINVSMEGYVFYNKVYYPAYMVDNFAKIMSDNDLKDFKEIFLIPHLVENSNISPFSLKTSNKDRRVVQYISFIDEGMVIVHNSTVVFLSLKALNKYLQFEEIATINKTKAISDLMEKINIS